MPSTTSLYSPDGFSEILYEKMKSLSPSVADLALYEFRYALNTIVPVGGNWEAVKVLPCAELEAEVMCLEFFENIQIKPKAEGKIVLDEKITWLTRVLISGLVGGQYALEWVRQNFTFDTRGFNFLVKSPYLVPEIVEYLGGTPWQSFTHGQNKLDKMLEVGYKDFEIANRDVDACFIDVVMRLIHAKGTPILLAIAGPTAAGKTEIVERLSFAMEAEGKKISSVEMDNFLTDRDQREARGIGSLGREALHFELLTACLDELRAGRAVQTPCYDFFEATSSHDLNGMLKPGREPGRIDPADIIFIEGNAPFLFDEIAPMISIKVVYLTEDSVRLKRKWRRDIDLRKKYDPFYLRNRFFREQYIMAVRCYQPQLKRCDIFVHTTDAEIWLTPNVAELLN